MCATDLLRRSWRSADGAFFVLRRCTEMLMLDVTSSSGISQPFFLTRDPAFLQWLFSCRLHPQCVLCVVCTAINDGSRCFHPVFARSPARAEPRSPPDYPTAATTIAAAIFDPLLGLSQCSPSYYPTAATTIPPALFDPLLGLSQRSSASGAVRGPGPPHRRALTLA